MKHLSLIASALAVLGLTACEKGLDVVEDGISSDVGQVKNSLLQVRTRGSGENNGSVDDGSAVGNSNNFPKAGDTYEGCYVLASVVANDGESAELTLLSPNEKYYANVSGVTLSYLQTKAAEQGTDNISDWRPMTLAEAHLLQAAHTDLSIDGTRQYLFDDNGTPKQILMSDGTVSTPGANAAYVRPVATVTINNK